MRLSLKLILVVTLLSLASSAVLIWRNVTLVNKLTIDTVGRQQLQLAHHTMSQIDTYLYERVRNIETLAQVARVGTMLTENVDQVGKQAWIDQIARMNGPWDSVMLVSNEGVVVASTQEEEVGKKVVDSSITYQQYLKAREGVISYSDNILSEASGKETMVFAAPVWLQDKQVVTQRGVILAHMAWPPLSEILSKVSSHAVLINNQGTVIAENNAYGFSVLLGEDVRGVEMIDNAITKKEAHYAMTTSLTGNVPVLMSHVNEAGQLDYMGNGWMLGLEIPRDTVLAETKPWILEMILSIIPILVVVITLIVLVVVVVVVRPISQLRKESSLLLGQVVDSSGLSHSKSKDEIELLRDTFNQMATQLEQRQSETPPQIPL